MLGHYHPLHVYLGWDGAAVALAEDTVEACWPWLVWDLVEACWPCLVSFLAVDLVEACWPRLVSQLRLLEVI